MSSKAMKDCTETCKKCRTTCEETLFRTCLEEGGAHMEPSHVRIMTDCIAICQAAADSMVRGSDQHVVFCRACADICEACARSCEKIDSAEMKACAQECYDCATKCREMGQQKKNAA